MKKLIPGLLSILLCLGMATSCDAVKLPGFVENLLGKESASEAPADSSTPDSSSTTTVTGPEKDLKDVKEYLQEQINGGMH